jgi:hypothetical protein
VLIFIDACEVAIGKFPDDATIDAIDTTPIFADDICADATDNPLTIDTAPLNLAAPIVADPNCIDVNDPVTPPYNDDIVIAACDASTAPATPDDIVAEAIETAL